MPKERIMRRIMSVIRCCGSCVFFSLQNVPFGVDVWRCTHPDYDNYLVDWHMYCKHHEYRDEGESVRGMIQEKLTETTK
jgi:hypothetical protein